MSLEDEGEKPSLECPIEIALQPPKPRLRYTREFLLSFGDLDVCRKLPSGFDVSVLRGVGGLPLQNLKQVDYGSIPSRLDSSSSYSRGGSGRWDTRSSGSSDRDGDLHFDRETSMQESGRCFGNQSHRFSQHQEHDGLLGSGAFPRPSGYAGASAPKDRGDGHYQLNWSTEPYQPPRSYKAIPRSRKEHTDSINDETFGSAEFSTQDGADEERRRRESFELMRKEQQKTLKEKHKQIPDNQKENFGNADLIAFLETSEENRSKWNENKLEISVPTSNSQSDTSRSPHILAPPSRPLVPPGFASVILEKNLFVEPSNNCPQEAGTAVINDKCPINYPDNGDEKVNQLNSGAGVMKHSVEFEKNHGNTFDLQEGNEVWEDDKIEFSNNKELRSEIVGTDQSSSILDKLFGSALSASFSSLPKTIEHQGAKANEDTKISAETESSKFAHWFLDEDKKSVEDFSSKNLLSLIINKEPLTSQVSEFPLDKALESTKPSLSFENQESIHRHCEFPAAVSVPIPSPYYQSDSQDTHPGVLTCEDLEQSILAEVKDNSIVLQQSVQGPRMGLDHESGGQKTRVNDHASEHLLSLLRKETDSKESISPPGNDLMVSLIDGTDISYAKASPNKVDNPTIKNSEKVQSSDKTLTLEALFGAAFMNELHSVEVPLSVQRGSVGRIGEPDVPQSLELQPSENNVISPTLGEVQPYTQGSEKVFTHTQGAKANEIPGLWQGHSDSSNMGLKLGDATSSKRVAMDIHLPEEDSLIRVSDSLNHITSDPAPLRALNRNDEPLEQPSDPVLMAILRSAEHAGQGHIPQPNFSGNRSGLVDSDKLHHHLHGRSSSQFPHAMNQVGPLFPQMEHHIDMHPQMRLIGSENIRPQLQYPFPANVFPQHALHSGNRPQFDPVGHHPIFQHMPIPGNLPPHHPHHGFPRGALPSYSMNLMDGYRAEMNNMHGFPLNHQPPNFGGHGMRMPGPVIGNDGGRNPPLFDQLIEMELRANSKQIHPAAARQIHGANGPELDMSFR
ncbi:hypothetical protein J5N97_025274 [Dioscorea zingiberensis]|uniref:Uncharacterized protein n=1 Tax=Dioscorea zingiberensis TaxID=325984 RepID=A0A9D5H9N9_9LILI|nr:hypothetical protein J5N97_025274 [Dioscorea zingiberensis]